MPESNNTDKKKEYNEEPVYYCKNCLSLNILTFENTDYCDSCGSTSIDTTDIETWKKEYRNKYKKDF